MRTSKRFRKFQASFTTRGPAQTRKLATSLGKALAGGEIIHLYGGLGSGKTCFVQGLAEGLAVADAGTASSPTFTLINEYPGEIPLIHADLYRLENHDDIRRLGLEDHFDMGVVVVEWAEKLPPEYRSRDVTVRLTTLSDKVRRIDIEAEGKAAEALTRILSNSRMEEPPDRKTRERSPRGDTPDTP